MKNILIYNLILMSSIMACRDESESLLMGRPEDRLDQILKDYKQQLISSPSGWKGFLFPERGRGYSFFLEFNSSSRVTMMADVNGDCEIEPFESSFRLEAVQRPSLFFDTYSYMHILSDPNPDTIGGVPGHGLYSDFEFAFESTKGDTIMLKGNQHGSPLLLIKATAEESQAYKAGELNTIHTGMAAYVEDHPFTYLQARDGKRITTSFAMDTKTFSLSYRQGDTLNIQTAPFGFSTRGMFLQKVVRYKDVAFREIFYDSDQKFYIVANGDRIDLTVSPDPILPLHLLLGVDFSTISVPIVELEDEWSQSFKNLILDAGDALNYRGFFLRFIEIDFNTVNKTVNFNFFIYSPTTGTLYLAQYPYSYIKSPDGVFRFTLYDEPNGNGKYIESSVEPILRCFTNYRFRMEYLQTSEGHVALLKCVEQPTLYFTGNFGSALN